MYYASGNYEAFARPRRPAGVESKSAYIIGTGLAALTAACYLVRDGQMDGGRVHVYEKDSKPGERATVMSTLAWGMSCGEGGRWTTILK